MVVVNEPTVVDFIVVIEATANMVAHWDAIKKKYILPTVEYFNGRRPSPDYIGNNGCSRFGYVLYHSYDNGSELFTSCSSVTQSPWEFVRSLDTISFIGGGCERFSNVAEGLGRALQVFDDLSQMRGSGKSRKVCLLVCNSPPYDLPCYENCLYAGQKSENLAELMGNKGINLSVMSPQHIPQVKQLFLAANVNNSSVLNYAHDPRHLVLTSGFTLPTEQDPVKVEPKDDATVAKPSAMANNVPVTSSVPSPAVQHLSPSSNFSHTNQGTAVNSPANVLQQNSSVPQTVPVETKFSPGMSSVSTTQNSNGLIVSSSINASISATSPANTAGKPQATMNVIPTSQVNQPQQQMSNFNVDESLSHSVSNIPFPRSLNQNSSSGNVMTSAMISINSTGKEMLQNSMIQTQSSEAQMRMSDMAPQVRPNRGNNMLTTSVTSGVSAHSLQSNLMFSTQSIKTMQDQQRMTPQSVASNSVESSAVGTSHNMPQVPPYSNSLSSNNLPNTQLQQKNPMGPVGNTDPLSNFTGSPVSSLQQMNPSNLANNSSQQMISRNLQQPAQNQMTTMPAVNMLHSANPQLRNNSMQMDPTINQTQTMGNAASISRMANNDQAPNVVVLPTETRPLWRGILEWKEKRRVPSGTAERTTHHLQCEVFSRSNQNDEALNVASWPSTLTMQLVPQVVFTYRDMKAQIKNNITVSLRMTPNDQMVHLANTMQSKWMGVIQTHSVPIPQVENRVILVLYSQKSNVFMGLVPRDSATFISTIRQVIQTHQNQARQPSAGGPQSGLPPPNIDHPQFPSDNRMPPHLSANPNHFILTQNPMQGPNAVARPMNPMQPQPNRQNTSMPARQNMQMPGVSNQAQMGFNPSAQRVSGNVPMMNQQMQQPTNMQSQMQQGGVGNQQYNVYQSNINQRQMVPPRPVINHNNSEMTRQQLQRIRMQQQQQQQQQQQNQQFGRMNQVPVSHNPGEEHLRALLQGPNSMSQGINQQRPTMHPANTGMRQMHQGAARQGYLPNQMRHQLQPSRMIGIQQPASNQTRFGSGM